MTEREIEVDTDKLKQFIKKFMEKPNNNEFVKDTCPQLGEVFVPTNDILEEELRKYKELLDSGILGNITKDCRTCQNMGCRVEQNEKNIDDCLGYINHKYNKKEKTICKNIIKKNIKY